MRILFISSYFPVDLYTSKHGVYKRMSMFIDAIKEIAEIDMLFYVKPEHYRTENIQEIERSLSTHWNTSFNLFLCPKSEFKEDTEISKWLSLGAGIFSFFKQKERIQYSGRKQIEALEKCLDRDPCAIFAHRLSAMCPLLLTEKSLPPVFFDLDDIEHVVFKRYISNRKNLRSNLLNLLLPSLSKGEYIAVKLASKTFVCSEYDRKYLSQEFNLPGIVVVPNSINVPKLEPLTSEPVLLYLSSDYGPNIQAAEFLIQEIWPGVIKKVPDAKLVIAGISPDKLNMKQSDIPGLELPGFVEDLDALYKKTRATAVSLLVGGGTRFKIIEAAMYGKPTVSTTVGAEGLELTDTEEILIRDTPETFAEACVKLLKDRDLSEKIGLAAREKAIELYDSQKVVETIKKEILEEFP